MLFVLPNLALVVFFCSGAIFLYRSFTKKPGKRGLVLVMVISLIIWAAFAYYAASIGYERAAL